jgi:hypothetical protein
MGNDWWRIVGKAWYYAQLYRLERGYEIFPEEKKVLRVHGVTSYDENIRRENGEYAEKWRDREDPMQRISMDKSVTTWVESKQKPIIIPIFISYLFQLLANYRNTPPTPILIKNFTDLKPI